MNAPLMEASRQWASRPADQRFDSLEALHAAVSHHREVAAEQKHVAISKLRITTAMDSQGVVHPVLGTTTTDQTAKFSHFGFGSFARRLSNADNPVPASYLRTLPAGLASANLNNAIKNATARDLSDTTILFAQNGDLVARAFTSDDYTRIWNVDITKRLLEFVRLNPDWQPAPAAFDGSRGLYASDKDIFAFLVDNDRRIFESLPGGGLGRGFFLSNSEVGDRSFSITTFWYQYICGNHMVWGAKGVANLRIPHIGDADERAFRKMAVELRRYADASTAGDEAKVASMIKTTVEGTKDEVLDKLFGLGISRKVAAQAVDIADRSEDRYGNPRSVFALVSGITEIARDKVNADERVKLEAAAGKVAQIAFA